jgi:hypothetical protein
MISLAEIRAYGSFDQNRAAFCCLKKQNKIFVAADIILSPETPPEFVLNVSSTESSPKDASLSGRKRLSELFR